MSGRSWIVTTVDPLVALNCSMFSSTLLSSALGRMKPFSEGGLEKDMLPDTELMPTGVRGMWDWTVDWDILGRGLVEAPSTLETCVLRLYVLRMMRRAVRIMMIPTTMTAIMAPELWMRTCSLDLVMVVVLAAVVLVTGDTVDIFSVIPWISISSSYSHDMSTVLW